MSNQFLKRKTLTIILKTPMIINNNSKDQSNLAKAGIAHRMYSPGSRIGLAIWLQKFATACFGWGFDPQISPSQGGQGSPYNNVSLDPTRVHAKWHPNPSNSLDRGHKCYRQTNDSQEQFHLIIIIIIIMDIGHICREP